MLSTRQLHRHCIVDALKSRLILIYRLDYFPGPSHRSQPATDSSLPSGCCLLITISAWWKIGPCPQIIPLQQFPEAFWSISLSLMPTISNALIELNWRRMVSIMNLFQKEFQNARYPWFVIQFASCANGCYEKRRSLPNRMLSPGANA